MASDGAAQAYKSITVIRARQFVSWSIIPDSDSVILTVAITYIAVPERGGTAKLNSYELYESVS